MEIPFVTCLFFLILTAFLMPGPRYQQRGDWQVEARNWPGAIFQYRRAASRDPWNAAVHHSLSRVLREQFMATRQGYFFVESREAGERAREIAPRNPQYAENLGVIMLEMGNQEAGLELLREAVSLSPLDATFYEKLMQGYGAAGNRAVRDGDRSLAREYYQEGLAVREQFDQAAARSTEPVRQRGTIDQLHAELESLLEELGADEGERLAEP